MKYRRTFRLRTVQAIIAAVLVFSPLIFVTVFDLLAHPGEDGDTGRYQSSFRVFSIGALGLMTFVIPFVMFFVKRNLICPILRLSEAAREFAKGRPTIVRERMAIEEMDTLAINMNDMVESVMKREDELTQLNELLEEKVRERTQAHEATISTLCSMRNQLLLSEKMAALSSLVSGVALELNKSMSIGVTAASFLNERTRILRRDMDTGALSQENFERFLTDSDESSRIIQQNLDHAARIINSLKRVAVDQKTEERREFELGSYINDIILSLRHQLRSGKHDIEAHSEDIIMMNSFPGALTQILNNLVFNSVVHGFGESQGGKIRIESHLEGDEVVLSYTDDGRGLTEEEQEKLFEQFFTTRRDQGGMGLGMKIVQDQVTQRLRGQIELALPPAGGVGFIIRFPQFAGM